MVESVAGLRQHISLSPDKLLFGDESILIVDDDPLLRDPLRIYLEDQNLAVGEADSAAGMMRLLESQDHNVALILLDIGLPDMDGRDILPQIVQKYPDVAIVMLTGVADLRVALECIREGADDYLSKPVQFNEILFVVKKVLEKRRLIFENRKYQEDLENAHFRIRLLHQLSIKMNTVYLSTTELDEILLAILVGITANEGLRFNRAFLALFDEAETVLQGRIAIGPSSKEDAQQIWSEMSNKRLNFFDLVHSMKESCARDDLVVNKITKALRVARKTTDNILIRSTIDRRSVMVSAENNCIPELIERRETRSNGEETLFLKERRKDSSGKKTGHLQVPDELIKLLREDTFVVVPLYSPRRSFGVIIADNFVTKEKITDTHVSALELFASQASLAIEHSHLYTDMQKTISELEVLNHELDKNKDQLVATERYSALGHMSAQLVHAIRNPITSIGGVSRILEKKITNEEWQKYIRVMIKETGRLESTLEDLFDFVSHSEFHMQKIPLYSMLKKTLLLLQSDLTKHKILWEFDLKEPEPFVNIDEKQVQQMFLHLFKNSIEAMPGGGNLTIEAQVFDKVAHVSILDTGIGIHDSHIDKAKDPFFTTKTYGTGMGLTMVDRIVKAHDGSFAMQKRETGGMEVKVDFSNCGVGLLFRTDYIHSMKIDDLLTVKDWQIFGKNDAGKVLTEKIVSEKLDLVTGQLFKSRVLGFTDDKRVLLEINNRTLAAESRVPLKVGSELWLEVKGTGKSIFLSQAMKKGAVHEFIRHALSDNPVIKKTITSLVSFAKVPLGNIPPRELVKFVPLLRFFTSGAISGKQDVASLLESLIMLGKNTKGDSPAAIKNQTFERLFTDFLAMLQTQGKNLPHRHEGNGAQWFGKIAVAYRVVESN